ncbi:MAG: DUF4422 domain-containing protein [Lachnospiraceae bacterium]|nr:DUF4422 domain-containing protein [Lachnospiraceae bacterium]
MDSQLYVKGKRELYNLLDEIKSYKYLYIYSAGNRAKEIVQMRKIGFLDIPLPSGFLVTEMKGNRECIDNPVQIDGIPVCVLGECDEAPDLDDTVVFVTAMEHYHHDIRQNLAGSRFHHICYLSDVMERILVADCMKYYFEQCGIPFTMTDMMDTDVKIIPRSSTPVSVMTYMVQSAKDEKLSEERAPRDWVTPLQAGAALAKERVLEVTDADGDNISEQNTYYNEMTGLYWVWKNTDWDVTGICHYRRQFESSIVLQPVLDGDADVVLPMPALVYPDLRGYYRNWGEDEYYQIMLEVIKERHSGYYETAVWCASHSIFFPNNIFLARKAVLDDYGLFAFDVIEETEKRAAECGCKKQARCWQSEHITTIYFMKHIRHYRIVFSNLRRFW